ncbi:YggT family protein [Pyruvatibacter sp. HU-CL02332]|uniref:YggT family protein n=1 Tax=Pyruvatibacter sp. HU-CL02332 TaxID=3127650 RepID=UPI0031085F40
MQAIALIALFILDIAWWFVIISVILSWLIAFNVLDTRNNFVYQITNMFHQLTEPLYRPIRNIMPDLGGIDLSPLIVLVGIYALRVIIITYML